MDDIYKDESEFGQNSERSLNDELSDLPMSLDPNLSNHLCSACGVPCLDIGLESGEHGYSYGSSMVERRLRQQGAGL